MIRLYILILIIIVILILLYIFFQKYSSSSNQCSSSSNQCSSSSNQCSSSSNQCSSYSNELWIKQKNDYLLDLYKSRLYNYKYNRNSCFIHSSLQLLRTFFSLLVIDKIITLDNDNINTLLNFNAFDTNRNLYFPDLPNPYAKNYNPTTNVHTIWNYMNPDQQHDVSAFLSEIFINIIDKKVIQNNIIISYDTEMKDIFIKLGVTVKDITIESIQRQLQDEKDKKVEYNEYMIIHLQGNHRSNFIFTDVTNDIIIDNNTYSPYSIIQYAGNGYGGHYVNYSKKPNTSNLNGEWSWYKYDDTQKEVIKSEEGITKNPVVILYKRIKK